MREDLKQVLIFRLDGGVERKFAAETEAIRQLWDEHMALKAAARDLLQARPGIQQEAAERRLKELMGW
jgi:hypothetical protein